MIKILVCIGLHHQGVFRVSGSQLEINSFKESFERGNEIFGSFSLVKESSFGFSGEDPLTDVADASDVNSVAGVLKLYFRELREPLFPIFMFDQFVECSSKADKKFHRFCSFSIHFAVSFF